MSLTYSLAKSGTHAYKPKTPYADQISMQLYGMSKHDLMHTVDTPLSATAAKGSVTCISSKHSTAANLRAGISQPKLTSPSLPLIRL